MFSKINYKLLTNALTFQVTWFICVQGNNLHAILATAILLAVHLFIFKINAIQDVKISLLMFVLCLIGFLGDSLIASAVYLTYSSNWSSEGISAISFISTLPVSIPSIFEPILDPVFASLFTSAEFAPIWLLCLWISFSTTINHSMKWLFQSPAISFFVGLLLVPLSYIAGIQLSASTLLSPYWQFFILEGLWWAIVLTIFQKLSTISDLSLPKGTSHV